MGHSTRATLLVILGAGILGLRQSRGIDLIPWAPELLVGITCGSILYVLPLMRARPWRGSGVMLYLLGTLFLVALLSSAWSTSPLLSVQRAALVFLSCFSTALVVGVDDRPERTFGTLALGFVHVASTLSVIGLVLHLFGTVSFGHGGMVESVIVGPFVISQAIAGIPPFVRISSLTQNPNSLAAWLMVSIPFCFMLRKAGRLSRSSFALAAGVQTVTLILTWSRAGIAATILGLAVWSVLHPLGLRRRVGRAVVLLAALLAAGIMFSWLGPDLEELESDRFLLGTTDRDAAWKVALESFSDSPVGGVGFGVSDETLLDTRGMSIGAHNAYLTVLVETGVAGLVLFAGLWALGLVSAVRGALSGSERHWAVGIAAALAALAINQAVESMVLRYSSYTYLWTYLIALAARLRSAGVSGEPQGAGRTSELSEAVGYFRLR